MSEKFEVLSPEGAQFLGSRLGVLERFAGLLAAEGELRGLIGPREAERLWSRHILNSAAVVEFLQGHAAVADVGSGAGFPGVVVAALVPGTTVHLIEPMVRRIEWLRYVRNELGLTNVVIHRARAEELHGELLADVVTARAVANLVKLAGWCGPLLAPGGRLVLVKGQRAQQELDDAGQALARHGLEEGRVVETAVPMNSQPARIVTAMKRRR